MKYKLKRGTMFVVVSAILLTLAFTIINISFNKVLDYSACKNEEGPVIETKDNGHSNKLKLMFMLHK